MPGVVMAMARLNRPSLMVYGGTIKPGVLTSSGAAIDIVSAFQSYGELSLPTLAVLGTPWTSLGFRVRQAELITEA